ncbi:MAG: ice-binding family protein [Desulfobaccales bacterium]|jgi:Flp pilus assembly protein TadG
MLWEKARLHRRAKDFIVNESGAIALVMVVALVALMAAAALAVDYGYMLVVQRQLQNAADAGALSGADAFGSNSPNSQAAQTAATTAATAIVTGNYWGNQQYLTYCTVTPGYWSNVNKGFTGTTSTTATLPTQTPPAVWAIQVVVPKSSSNNGGPLQLIFGPILGIETVNLNGTAVAMVKSPSVTWSVLETGSSSITLNSNVTINGGSVGDNGSSLTLDNGVTVPQGQVYINTATSVTNNSGLTPVQNSASNTLLSQAISSANAAYTNFIGLSNNTGTYSNAGQSANLSITGTNTVNVVDISNLLLDNPYNITLNGTSAMSFVVRVSGTFTLNSNTSVLLSGGLTAGNVTFIATGGSVIIDGGTMNGSILTQNSSVTLNSSATLNGSIVSGQSIMLDHGVTTPSTTFMSSSSGSALVQ